MSAAAGEELLRLLLSLKEGGSLSVVDCASVRWSQFNKFTHARARQLLAVTAATCCHGRFSGPALHGYDGCMATAAARGFEHLLCSTCSARPALLGLPCLFSGRAQRGAKLLRV